MSEHRTKTVDGTIHACDSSRVYKEINMVWTLCGRDVPANKSFESNEKITCHSCIVRMTNQDPTVNPDAEHTSKHCGRVSDADKIVEL